MINFANYLCTAFYLLRRFVRPPYKKTAGGLFLRLSDMPFLFFLPAHGLGMTAERFKGFRADDVFHFAGVF